MRRPIITLPLDMGAVGRICMEAWDREAPTLRVPPVVTVKFSRNATPEEVEVAREQIESLIPDLARLRAIEEAAREVCEHYEGAGPDVPMLGWSDIAALRAALDAER